MLYSPILTSGFCHRDTINLNNLNPVPLGLELWAHTVLAELGRDLCRHFHPLLKLSAS